MRDALRIALVWLLVLVALPLGGIELERVVDPDTCAPWCSCEDQDALAASTHDEHGCEEGEACEDCSADEDCEESCHESCDGCCDARVPLALTTERVQAAPGLAVLADTPPAREAPGRRIHSGVFRPPRSAS